MTKPELNIELTVQVEIEDPYAECPHAREAIERALSRTELPPYQEDVMPGVTNEKEWRARHTNELRQELLRQFMEAEERVRLAKKRAGESTKSRNDVS